MINREVTIRWKGYDPNKLSHGSHKHVWSVCGQCGQGRWAPYREARVRTMCYECAHPGKVKKVCEQCGKEFRVHPSKKGRSRFCSRECKSKWQSENQMGENNPAWKPKIVKVCKWCGKNFEVQPSRVDRQYFCSAECQFKWRSEHFSGENNILWKPRVKKTCPQCGMEFDILPSELEVRVCCSKECLNIWQTSEKTLKICEQCGKEFYVRPSEQHRRLCSNECKGEWMTVQRIVKVCERCGAEFEVVPSDGDQKFCSNVCKGIGMSGENATNWKGGITPRNARIRSSKTYKNWRRSVFERDDYTCQKCGIRGAYIQAHHIEKFSDNKNTLLIFDINNGITLCKDCHDETKGKEHEFVNMFREIISCDVKRHNP